MSIITWRIRTFFCPLRKCRSGILSLLQEGLLLLRSNLFERISQSVCVFAFGTGEDDYLSCLCQTSDPDWNYMSLSSNIVQLPSTDNSLSLSCQRALSFVFDSWRLFTDPFLQHRCGRSSSYSASILCKQSDICLVLSSWNYDYRSKELKLVQLLCNNSLSSDRIFQRTISHVIPSRMATQQFLFDISYQLIFRLCQKKWFEH